MANLVKISVLTLSVFLVVIGLTVGFSFDGKTVPCKGVNVTGYPKMKEQYLSCNKTVYETYKKDKVEPSGYAPMICTALCTLREDKLIDEKTGKLDKAGLKNYEGMFNHMPEVVRKDIRGAFDKCFDEHANDVIYNSTIPATECETVIGFAMCIKSKIDAVCNPEEPEKDDESTTAHS